MFEKCLVIVVEKTDGLETMLKSFGYEKRNGTCAYVREHINIIPKKKWYWFSNDLLGTRLNSL